VRVLEKALYLLKRNVLSVDSVFDVNVTCDESVLKSGTSLLEIRVIQDFFTDTYNRLLP
jgi:hypothetical protein